MRAFFDVLENFAAEDLKTCVADGGFKFSEEKDLYVLTCPFMDNLTAKDVRVTYDNKDNVILISASKKTGTTRYSQSSLNTVPDDADCDTLDANLFDGVLTVTVKRVAKPEVTKKEKGPESVPIFKR